jgi:hypothetical protein
MSEAHAALKFDGAAALASAMVELAAAAPNVGVHYV